MKNILAVLFVSLFALTWIGCGPKAFTKGDYEDVEQENLLNDKWSETDMQKAVKDLVDSLVEHYSIKNASKPPVIMVTRLENKTDEHIDTQSVMDMVRVELTNRGRVAFVDKEARDDVKDEYDYQQSGMVKGSTAKGPGKQIGADYVLNGRLDSIVQEVGKNKTVYYKITLNMTNLESNIITWTNHKQIRKRYKKSTISM